MMTEAVRGMVSNAALLLLMGLVQFLLPRGTEGWTRRRKLEAGVLLGFLGVGLLLTRWELRPGLFFDTRSVLLALSGPFFGLLPTVVAGTFMTAFRIVQGGLGMITGVGVIVSSATLGLLWARVLPHRRSWLDYYLLGVVVHLVMLAWMFAMPWEMALATLRQIAVPVLVIYPLATMLLGKLLEIQEISRDIREARLRNERRLQGMLDQAWEVVHLIEEDGRSAYVSDSVRKILGHDSRELTGKVFHELVHPEDRPEALAAFDSLLARPGLTETRVLRLRHADGHWVWFEHLGTNFLHEPAIEAIVVNSRDVTERLEKEREIRTWQNLMQDVIRHDPVGIAVLDRDLHFTFVSDRFLSDYRVRKEGVLGRHHYDVFPDLPEKWRRAHRRALKGEVVKADDDVFVREDGTMESTRWQVRPWYGEEGAVGGIILYTELTTARRKMEQTFRAVLQTSLEGFWVGDLNGNILEVNDTLCRNLGYARDELVGMKVHEIDALESAGEVRRHLEEVVQGAGTRFLTRHRRKDGSLMDVEVSVTHLNVEGGRVYVFVRDMTAHIQAQRSLEKERQRLENIIRGTGVGTWEWNVQTGGIVIDERWAKMLGYTLDELTPTTFGTWKALIHPEDLSKTMDRLNRHVSGDTEAYESEMRMRHKEGHWVWIQDRGKVVDRTPAGEPLRMFGTHADVTRRNRMHQALRESEEYLRTFVESAPVAILSLTPEGLVRSWNRAAEEIFGWMEEEVLGRPVPIVPKEKDGEFLDLFGRVLEGEVIEGVELIRRRKDGTEVIVSLSARAISDRDGGVTSVVAVLLDVTARRKAERRLEESERLYRNLFQDHSAVKFLIDPETGAILDANRAAEMFYGWSVEELKTMNVSDLNTLPEEEIRREMRDALAEKRIHFEFQHRRADGSVRDVEVFSGTVDVKGKEVLHSIVHDITDQRELEEQLRQSQKMEAVGRLAGGVAHDFNNMLAVIMGATEMALPQVPADSRLAEDLEQIDKAAQRSADLTRQLLAFSRKQIIEPVASNLNDLVVEHQKTLGRLIGEDIEIQMGLRGDLWDVFIDPSQVAQILANLSVNARDAIHGVGTLTIDTDNVVLDEKHALEDMPLRQEEYVMLSVSDSGEGMDSETLKYIFEPFFTTKKEDEGTGLGLATVYGIVKQNHGVIHVYSEPGMGTTLKIYLPRHREAEREEEEEGSRAPTRGTETILVVEDEEAILDLAKRYLEELGYSVLVASAPENALATVASHPGEIDLLLTDVVMPGMNGKELQEKARRKRPGLRTLFMSGYTANVIAKRGVLDQGVAFIQKPFTMSTLSHRVRDVLDGSR